MNNPEYVAHSPELCAAGKCQHAVSERVPCRCPDCDALTAQMVAGYRNETAARRVQLGAEITPRFAERRFERFIVSPENTEAYDAARAVAAFPKRGLAIYGQPGLGKSLLASAIVNVCNDRQTVAKYVGVVDLLDSIRETFDAKKGANTEHSIIRGYATVPVLVLDDLGKESLSEWNVRTMYALINRRYEQNLPLVVTTNFSPEQLAGRRVAAGAEPTTYRSTMDRVGQMVGHWVEIRGVTHR